MNILLVEDNPADATLLQEQLDDTCKFRTDVTHCLNLATAQASAAKSQYDVVILDLNLPDSHGLDTVRSMQSSCPDTPIVVLSGDNDTEMALRAVRLGIEEFILKGLEAPSTLASLMTRAVERKTRTYNNSTLRHFRLPESPRELDRFCEDIGAVMVSDAANALKTVILLVELTRSCRHQKLELNCDHWVFVVEGMSQTDDIESLAANLKEDLCAPIRAGREQIKTSVRIGIGISPDDATGPKELLSKALQAMNKQEGVGQDRWHFYRNALNVQSERRHKLVEEFQVALSNREFSLYYQPFVDARSRIVVGMEGLLRWQQPGGGLVPAAAFIPFAEKNGLIRKIDEFVLDSVGRQIRHWRVHCDDELPISINLSAGHFTDKNLVGTISGMLEQYDIEPRLIELELTESSLIDDFASVQKVMHDLRAMGVRLAIDDFGTQYASLDYLRRLPIDRLKIDKSFVRDLPDLKTVAVIRSIVGLCHDLGLRVTAEGIETEDQAEQLIDAGCDDLQGYLFSKPAPASEHHSIYEFNRLALAEPVENDYAVILERAAR